MLCFTLKAGKIRFIGLLVLVSCIQNKKTYNEDITSPIEIVRIDSKKILDSLEQNADIIFIDDINYLKPTISTLYVDISKDIVTQVIENPIGTIMSIATYTSINSTEFYPNGQYMCKFTYNESGIKHGLFSCFYEDGRIRIRGEYDNGKDLI